MQPLSKDKFPEYQQTFAENGFVVLKGLISKEQLGELHTKIMAQFEQEKASGALFAGGGLMSGHLNCTPGAPSRFVYDALRDQGVIELIRALVPEATTAFYPSCNLNLPGSVAQHWHIDGVFLDNFLITNVAVVDTTLENGAIDLLPGTHKKFQRYWEFAVGRTYRGATRIPMERGDVLVRTSKLWHRGMPNNTQNARPMLAFTFGEQRGFQNVDDAFKLNDGKVGFQPNWFRPSALGRLRERTFVTAPITYSAYRFVRSLFGDKGYAA